MSVETNNRLLENERPMASHHEATGFMASDRIARLARDSAQIELSESAEMADLARALKQKSTNDVALVDQTRARTMARISQVVDYVFYLIYGLISLQFLLELLGANANNQIMQLITAITMPLLAPFNRILATPTTGAYQLQLSYLFALVFYLLLYLAMNGLFRLIANRKARV